MATPHSNVLTAPLLLSAAWGWACLFAHPAQGHEPGEMFVGRTAAGQLTVFLEFDQPVELPRSVFPSAPGFATSQMGFESQPLDAPVENRYRLDPSAEVRVTLVSIDPGAA